MEKKYSLSQKLFKNFILSCILPILAVCGVFSWLMGSYQSRVITGQAENNLTLISAYMTKYLNDIDHFTKIPYYHSYFTSRNSRNGLSAYERSRVEAELESMLQMTTYSRDDFGDIIVMSDGEVLYFDANDWYEYLPTVDPLNLRDWYLAAMEAEGRIAIVPFGDDMDTEGFYISRKLNNIFLPDQENVIMLELLTGDLHELLSSLTGSVPVMTAMTDSKGRIIYSSDDTAAEWEEYLGEERIWDGSRWWLDFERDLEDYPVAIHVLLSTSYITERVLVFLAMAASCTVLSCITAYFLFIKANRWIGESAEHIRSVLHEMETGDLNARCGEMDVKEFDAIAASVNGMAAELKKRIRNEYELTIAHKDLQLKSLQSQIQPHFIINTIYSFITLNQIGESERLNDAFYSFANLLRYVLRRDRDTTVGKELDFLENYFSLCMLRFGNRLSYDISCMEELKSFVIPRLCLQPLAENAVIHGVEPSESPCVITVDAVIEAGTIYIIIEDDGVGFRPGELNKKDSIGISNVERRLGIWDPDAKLNIYRAGGRTIQIISIPAGRGMQKEREGMA